MLTAKGPDDFRFEIIWLKMTENASTLWCTRAVRNAPCPAGGPAGGGAGSPARTITWAVYLKAYGLRGKEGLSEQLPASLFLFPANLYKIVQFVFNFWEFLQMTLVVSRNYLRFRHQRFLNIFRSVHIVSPSSENSH